MVVDVVDMVIPSLFLAKSSIQANEGASEGNVVGEEDGEVESEGVDDGLEVGSVEG